MALRKCIFSLLFGLSAMLLHAQNPTGMPFLKNYTPRDYKATPQNLSITKDKNGIFYFANAAGVLSYNGKEWHLNKIPGNSATTFVYCGSDNLLYVGAYNELGYFKKKNTGTLEYNSLKNQIKEDFGKIISINEINKIVYFQTNKGFFKSENQKITFIKAPGSLFVGHFFNGKFYVRVKEKGLYEFNGTNFSPVPNGEYFAALPVFGVVKTDSTLLVVTDTDLLRSRNNKPFEKINLPFSNFNTLKLLDNKLLSFGLFGDGLVITDLNFRIIHWLNNENGLQDATINDQVLDDEKNLWVALNRGISKIEVLSPVTTFGFNQGIKSSIESIKEHKNELYISTYNGVLYLNKNTQKFASVSNLNVDCYGLNEFSLNGDTALLVAANSGIYKISNKSANKIINCIPYNFAQSKFYQNRIFICNDDGFKSFSYVNGNWKQEDIDYKIDWPVLTFTEINDKTIWVSDLNEGVYRLTMQNSSTDKVKIDKFENNGLPKGFVYAFSYNTKPLFGTTDGLYEFDTKTNRFFKSSLNPKLNNKFSVHRMSVDLKNNLWLSVFYEKNQEYDICYFDGKKWITAPFKKSSDDIIQCIGYDKRVAYFGSAAGLFCYDYTNHIDYEKSFHTSIAYFTAGGIAQPIITQNNEHPILEYSLNDINFHFYSGTYTEESATQFSYYLEGFSKKWSEWSVSNEAIFTNLHEGDYVLKVKSKNLYDKISSETKFTFTILAPWYRTWWVYTLYIVLFSAFVYGAILFSTRSLKNIIKERTAEVVEQKEEIELQKLVLEEKNRDILDSIKYAKRIQEAIIPTEETLREAIGDDLFVFYKPKDIVSGDFYWMQQFDNTVLLAVVDCTGHGVPGAFVSIVGNNGLNRAVNEFGLREPAKILDKLSVLTEESFKQHGKEELRDGMDICLVAIDTTTREIQYAGANNPLWLIRSGNRFEEIKANKQPIGKFEARQPFTNHKITLEKGDSIFMFTDGYADQFGGENGKKFKYKQLQELILLNNQLKYPFLKSILVQSFENWKENYEQVDDVCLMGIKF